MNVMCEYYDPESGEIFMRCEIEEDHLPSINNAGKKEGLKLKWRVQLNKDGEKIPAKEKL